MSSKTSVDFDAAPVDVVINKTITHPTSDIDSDYDAPEIFAGDDVVASVAHDATDGDVGAGAAETAAGVGVADGAGDVGVGVAAGVADAADGAAAAGVGAAEADAAAGAGKNVILPVINYISDHKYYNLYIALNDCNNILYEFMELPTDLIQFITKTVISNEHLFSEYNTIQTFLRCNVLDVINGRVYFVNMTDNYKIRIFCQYIVQLYYLCYNKFDDDANCDVKSKLYSEIDFVELIRLDKMFKFDGLELYDMALRHTIMAKDNNIKINCFNNLIANAIGIRKSVLYMAFAVPNYSSDAANHSDDMYDNKNYSMSITRYIFDNSHYYDADWSKRFNLDEPIYSNLSQFFDVFAKFNIDYRDFKINNCFVKKLIIANVYISRYYKSVDNLYERFNIINSIKAATSRDEVISIIEKAARDLEKSEYSIHNYSEILKSDSTFQTSNELIQNTRPFNFNFDLDYALNDDQCNKLYSHLVSELSLHSNIYPNINVKIYNLIKQFNIMSREYFTDTVLISKSWKKIYMHFKQFVNMFCWIDTVYIINQVLDKKIAQLTIRDEYDNDDDDDDDNSTSINFDNINSNTEVSFQIEHVESPLKQPVISELTPAEESVVSPPPQLPAADESIESKCTQLIKLNFREIYANFLKRKEAEVMRAQAKQAEIMQTEAKETEAVKAEVASSVSSKRAKVNSVSASKRARIDSVSSKYGIKILPPRAAAKRL
nr:hypothetical protein [Spodoptera litura nucleopolyhedrovirus]